MEYKCSACGNIYNEKAGDPFARIQAYTAFKDLPADWACPQCGAAKSKFTVIPGGEVITTAAPPPKMEGY